MSMRSEVMVCMKKENYEKMKKEEKIKPLFEEEPDTYEEISEDVIVFGWEGIKWNLELYPDEKALMDYLHNNKKEPYKFCKLDYNGFSSEEENYIDGSCSHIYFTKRIAID